MPKNWYFTLRIEDFNLSDTRKLKRREVDKHLIFSARKLDIGLHKIRKAKATVPIRVNTDGSLTVFVTKSTGQVKNVFASNSQIEADFDNATVDITLYQDDPNSFLLVADQSFNWEIVALDEPPVIYQFPKA